MPLNIPSGTTNDISFGPGRLYIGAYGAGTTTPATDVGYISEDGVTVEITNESKDIMQGNPKLIEYTFSQAQGVNVSLTSIEWDFDNFVWALGAGSASADSAAKEFKYGGDPLMTQVAIKVEHQMAVTGNTMNVYCWKAVSNGGISAAFGADEHSFEMTFKLQRCATNWGGGSLDSKQQLIAFYRAL